MPRRSTPVGNRLAWLDALRAVAALLVLADHVSWHLLSEWRVQVYQWFIPGYAGVLLFFLVSGYIIPASLERRGSLRDFWIGRGFRLYPLFLVAVGATVALYLAGWHEYAPFITDHKAATVLAQGSMLTALLGIPDPLAVTWTLSFEMAFYLLVSGVYAVRRQRASPLIALGLAGVALAIGLLPKLWLVGVAPHAEPGVAGLAAVVFAAAIGAMLTGRRPLVLTGALVGAALAALLLVSNQAPAHLDDGLVLPAVMFTGTTIYRAEKGEIHWMWAVVTPLAVAVALVVQRLRLMAGTPSFAEAVHEDIVTAATVAAIFAAGFFLRHHRIPRVLAWLGMISYSIYLLHTPVLELLWPVLGGQDQPSTAPGAVRAVLFLATFALVIAVSAVSYRFVEAPGQRAGRLVVGWLDRRASARPVPQRRAAVENRWPVSLTARTATPESAQKSTIDSPAGSR
ncbi:MAG: acyltransferase [Micromonosporaceae bacterium]|nr:acyltransferase [Micromonosporaceae bacterium]